MRRSLSLFLALVLAAVWHASAALAQSGPNLPNFFDLNERLIRPELGDRPRLRFLTVTDFPPFSFVDDNKRLTGYHVDLARNICEKLDLLAVCQIQALPFNELEAALAAGQGEAILAGIPVDAISRERLAFSRPYFHLPGRFVAAKTSGLAEPLGQALAGKDVGIIDGTAHAAYAQAKFGDMRLRLFATEDQAWKSLRAGEITAIFADGLALAFQLQRDGDSGCCAFVGGPYLSRAYFGSGLTIALKKDDRDLLDGVNSAMQTLAGEGKLSELYLRYFPISLY